METAFAWTTSGRPHRLVWSPSRTHGRWLFLALMGLNIMGLAGGTTPARILNPTTTGPVWPTEEEESHPTGKAKSETVAVEHRRHHRHETLYRPAPGGPAIEISQYRRLDRPSSIPNVISAESDRMNGLGAPLLC